MGEKNATGSPHGGAEPALRAQIAALAEQVQRLAATRVAERPGAEPNVAEPAGAIAEPHAAGANLLAVDVIAMAERAAAEIRESARREAERIQCARQERTPASVTDLHTVLRRQRAALSVLVTEIERLERTAGILRSQTRALEAELALIHEIVGTSPPVPGSLPTSY